MKKRNRKKDYIRPVIVGFLALYLVSMLLSTYLVKCKYEEEYNDYLYTKRDDYYGYFLNTDIYLGREPEEKEVFIERYASAMLAQIGCHDKYQQIAAALYDMDGNRVAMTSNVFGYTASIIGKVDESEEGKTLYAMYEMKDYMSEEEIRGLAAYYDSSSEVFSEKKGESGVREYFAALAFDLDTNEPTGLDIVKKTWNPKQVASQEPVWHWRNENYAKEDIEMKYHPSEESTAIVYLPYITHGTKYWDIWQQDEWLQGFPESDISWNMDGDKEEEGIVKEIDMMVAFGYANDSSEVKMYRISLRQTAHPWLAAVDYMKYVYIMGLLLTIVCIIKVLYSTHKTYVQREKLEQTRRDFTNAAAHELKTPLSVIRGFAENLKENTIAEKKDYYLDQIIHQTEQMDGLVKEMINISKLDSEAFVLKKEQVSMITIIREQMSKFDFSMEEKNLHLIYEVEEDFSLDADIYQMKKVVWNLLANAVEYNRPDGSIWVFSDKDKVVIENTGEHIPEAKLPYVFDLFYTGDESRHDRGKHMGLGLYLAKKICSMHDLKLEICNTDAGVKITISR